MRAFLFQFRKDFIIPVVLVTHNVVEAYIMSDTLIVYVNGRVAQKGAPPEVFNNPFAEEVRELVPAMDQCRVDTVSGQ